MPWGKMACGTLRKLLRERRSSYLRSACVHALHQHMSTRGPIAAMSLLSLFLARVTARQKQLAGGAKEA